MQYVIELASNINLTANMTLINQAREFYREDKQIEEELGPDFDETAYISQSPKNVERLRRAIKQYETDQHISINLDNVEMGTGSG
ncbi:hypothetical protein PN36_01875 [Candidatus Thiomargarita nelsonii]|uniref:Uncharacterized protein n=1 Tax=Candidatus Thiomargarita nelsonii TaxID=1003181 RepID=A0A0A6P9X9_9GAMM|nr:hypothetical protein PN36_01875 [Candidatus Thiomargarita nelsonii]